MAEHSVSGSSSVWNDYIATPGGTLVLAVQSGSQPNVLEYLQQDNQGSTVALSDNSGNLIQQYAYDPYGRRSVSYTAPAYSGIQTDLGYTGHRQIDFLNLVHMRGRVYDPSLSRFLSADPNLQSPGNAQSLNRYAYVWNNPLTFTDPSGYFLSGFTNWFNQNWRTFASIAIAAGAAAFGAEYDVGPAAALAGGFASGVVASNGSLKSGLMGADFAVLNFGIGDGFGNVSASGLANGSQDNVYVQKVVIHGFVGAIQGRYAGESLGSGFLAGAAQAAAAPFLGGPELFRIAEAATIGGTASEIGGGKFANGAITGAFAEAFNDCLHGACDTKLEQTLYNWFPGYKAGTGVYNSFSSGTLNFTGWEALDLGSSLLGVAGKALGLLTDAVDTAADALPSTLARVIPNGIPAVNLGPPDAVDVFVTTPEAIEGLDSSGIAQALTIPESPSGFQVIQFATPEQGLASPVFRTNQGFVGGGYTAGGAPEFVIPNGPIPPGATITTVP